MIPLSLITATHNRPQMLGSIALPSLLAQTTSNFEWVVVNDGADPKTRSLISQLDPPFRIVYKEISHVGLGQARNLGLRSASGEIVAYLDDDNSLAPNFIESTSEFFEQNPHLCYSMCRQNRRRDVVENHEILKRGREFTSPTEGCRIDDLLLMKQLFDSNGFAHYRSNAPQWDDRLKIFCDYEYLLKCASIWGRERFQLNPTLLVDYIQTNQGIIGTSNYQQWSAELKHIWEQRENYSILGVLGDEFLLELIHQYQQKKSLELTAFSKREVG
jgi:glycosyltransferase involved in cell wall biosynthesis